MLTIDINCDVGEGIDNEAELMPYISSCSIACGAHAGDEKTIVNTIELARRYDVKIGAHPSFPDKANFGRKIINIASAELQESIETQINTIKMHVERVGAKLHHVKAHGALYNLAANDTTTAQILIGATKNTTENVFLYAPYNSLLVDLAQENKLKVKVEAFADRNYHTNLTLVSRKMKNAVLTNKKFVVDHVLKMIQQKQLISIDGVEVKIDAQTFCVHGDNPSAIEILKYISKELSKNEIKMA